MDNILQPAFFGNPVESTNHWQKTYRNAGESAKSDFIRDLIQNRVILFVTQFTMNARLFLVAINPIINLPAPYPALPYLSNAAALSCFQKKEDCFCKTVKSGYTENVLTASLFSGFSPYRNSPHLSIDAGIS